MPGDSQSQETIAKGTIDSDCVHKLGTPSTRSDKRIMNPNISILEDLNAPPFLRLPSPARHDDDYVDEVLDMEQDGGIWELDQKVQRMALGNGARRTKQKGSGGLCRPHDGDKEHRQRVMKALETADQLLELMKADKHRGIKRRSSANSRRPKGGSSMRTGGTSHVSVSVAGCKASTKRRRSKLMITGDPFDALDGFVPTKLYPIHEASCLEDAKDEDEDDVACAQSIQGMDKLPTLLDKREEDEINTVSTASTISEEKDEEDNASDSHERCLIAELRRESQSEASLPRQPQAPPSTNIRFEYFVLISDAPWNETEAVLQEITDECHQEVPRHEICGLDGACAGCASSIIQHGASADSRETTGYFDSSPGRQEGGGDSDDDDCESLVAETGAALSPEGILTRRIWHMPSSGCNGFNIKIFELCA